MANWIIKDSKGWVKDPGGEAILKKKQPVKDLVINAQESVIVKEISQKIVSDGWGTNRIANWLNDQGISTNNV